MKLKLSLGIKILYEFLWSNEINRSDIQKIMHHHSFALFLNNKESYNIYARQEDKGHYERMKIFGC